VLDHAYITLHKSRSQHVFVLPVNKCNDVDFPVDERNNVYLPVNKCKNVEHGSNVRVIVSICLLEVFQRLFTQWNGDLVATLRRVLDDKVV